MAKGFIVNAHVDLGGVTKKVGPAAVARGRMAMASQAKLDSEQFVPMRDGDLRASGAVEQGGKALSWNTVYARAHYYGTNGIVVFRKYTVPGTGKNWFTKAKARNLDKWKKKAMQGMGIK